jgi:hypothetical protein
MDTSEVKARKKKARRKWRVANREKDLADQRRRRQADPEKAREVVRKWRAENPERTQELSRENNRRRRQLSPERVREVKNAWNAAHPEKARERATKWRKENPEKRKAQVNKRRALKLGSFGSFTAQEWIDLKIVMGNQCLCCHRTEEVLLSLGLKLVPDHVVALVNGGSNDILNIQPLCHGRDGCNNKKHDKNTDYRKT